MLSKQCIIIGGGKSINEGIEKNLWTKLRDKFTIGCNYAYRYLDCTILTYVDKKFQNENKEDLIKHNLRISVLSNDMEQLHGGYYFHNLEIYRKDKPFNYGIYRKYLTGIWSLSIAIKLLGRGEIFLLGFDCKTDKKKDINDNNFHGINVEKQVVDYDKTKGKINRYLRPFESETDCKIYNVCPDSNINTFEKINYDSFFEKLNGEVFNQDELRMNIRSEINKQLGEK